ncbi:MAG TPA: FAD-dependent oxidoreductase [Nitrososphaeraceae archaeon]|nr:FAD-dependent oxidoreductase [Nitrososphaeraceae archaeon]
MRSSNKRIVILGAGYAGIFLATNIARYLEEKAGEVIIIDRNPYHQLLQEIHLVATGFRTADEVKIPILRLIDGMNIKFIQSNTKQIRPDKNLVVLDSTEIKYDVLIICLGASTKYFNIKGAKENSLPLRSISDASLIYDKVSTLIKSNNKQNIVIVGGGATGVSLGGALSDFIKENKKTDSLSITIIEALPTILPGWDERLVKKVNEVLQKKRIRIMTRSPVTKVENYGSSIYLSDDDDASKIHSSLTIWTAGVKGYDIPIDPEVEKTKDGKIVVNEFCQIDRYPNIFSIGDIAAVKDENQKLYPPLAQIAIREAKYLSKLIPKHFIDGSNVKALPDEKFEYSIKVQLISLGNDDYVGLFNHYVISGNLAKLVEEFARSTYIKSLKSGGRDIDASLYEDNIFSQLVSGITFARFTFMKWIEKKTQ